MGERDGLYEVAGRRRGEQRAMILLAVVGLALALVLGAFFLGRVFSDDTRGEEPTVADQRGEPGDVEASSLAEAAVGGTTQSARPKPDAPRADGRSGSSGPAYRGAISAVRVRGANATCTSPPSVDAGGRRTTYQPENTLDGSASTAWRCDGSGRGVVLTFDLGGARQIVAVGMIPGYAKTDPVDGTDRYAQNRRISRVRWSFDGGRAIEQSLDTAAGNRRLQVMRIRPVETRTVSVTILDSTGGSRDTVAISEARIAVPAG
jgi:hypothetical protein